MKKMKLVFLLLTLVLLQSALSAPLMEGRESDGEEGYKEWTWDDGYYKLTYYGAVLLTKKYANLQKGTYLRIPTLNYELQFSDDGRDYIYSDNAEYIGPLENEIVKHYKYYNSNKFHIINQYLQKVVLQTLKNDVTMLTHRMNLWNEIVTAWLLSIKPTQLQLDRLCKQFFEQERSFQLDVEILRVRSCDFLEELALIPGYSSVSNNCKNLLINTMIGVEESGGYLYLNEYALKKSVLEHAFSLKEINGFAHDIARYPEMGNINLVNKRKERIKHAVIFIKKLGYDKETLEKFAGSTYMVIKDEFNK
ncbi:MAG: hypothetical protein A2202_02045 [Bdellovibrionales bacterium RIFOXYA1_FULL_36_14]|nr:MAG: hypothetical protein A2202_02045 [Bdellovibrionales bacterium RIFOXYA1_FULL_36_14]